MIQRYKLRKLLVYNFNSREELINYAINEKKILIAVNAEKILKEDKKLIEIINNNIGYADGIGAVMALKQKGAKNPIKIPGVELWLDIVKTYYKTKSFFLIGSTDEVIKTCYEKLLLNYPGINIINFFSGFFDEEKKQKIKEEIHIKKPNIIFVAMGSPKQEFFMAELQSLHKALYMGLGGSFDVYTGKIPRAPKIFIKLGLEWFYRLIKQPFRIKRQMVLIKFLILLIFKKL